MESLDVLTLLLRLGWPLYVINRWIAVIDFIGTFGYEVRFFEIHVNLPKGAKEGRCSFF